MEEAIRGGARNKKLAIAFCCWARGYYDSKEKMDGFRNAPTTKLLSEMEGFATIWDEEKKRFGIRLNRNLLPDYATSEFWEAVQMWNDWKTFGFPNAGGSLDQGALYIAVLRCMNECAQNGKGL